MKRESNALLKVIPLLSFSITLRNDDEESKFSLPSKMAEPHGFNDVTNQPIDEPIPHIFVCYRKFCSYLLKMQHLMIHALDFS